jgi:hypothetical protein
LPSRLGDDPLTRAGRGAAKPSAESGAVAPPVALDSFGGQATSQTEIQSDSIAAAIAIQGSYNDVFFLRKSGGNSPPATNQVQQKIDDPAETREISEVSEIPEIREIAAAPIVGSERDAAAVAQSSQAQEGAGDAVNQGATAVASPETVATVETGVPVPVAQPATQVVPPIAPNQDPVGPAASIQDLGQSSGFFKKVFGKLGK